MKITTEEAQKIALLSRLSFADEDLEKMRDSMNSILTYMEELNQYGCSADRACRRAVQCHARRRPASVFYE